VVGKREIQNAGYCCSGIVDARGVKSRQTSQEGSVGADNMAANARLNGHFEI